MERMERGDALVLVAGLPSSVDQRIDQGRAKATGLLRRRPKPSSTPWRETTRWRSSPASCRGFRGTSSLRPGASVRCSEPDAKWQLAEVLANTARDQAGDLR